MRLVLLLLAVLSVVGSATAQDANNTTGTNETPVENTTNETPTEPPAAPEPAGPLAIALEAHTTGGSGYFTLAGESARNPTLRVAPGQEVTVTLTGMDDGVHNFCIGAGQCTAFVTSAGDSATFTFTAPATGTLEYYCQPHRSGGMKGSLAVGDAGAAPGGESPGEGEAITGGTIDLGQYDAACAGKLAPAIVTSGITGAPTIEDYVARCNTAAGAATTATRDASGADYVIPVSWALIGLGIVGVVWVHKYYKP